MCVRCVFVSLSFWITYKDFIAVDDRIVLPSDVVLRLNCAAGERVAGLMKRLRATHGRLMLLRHETGTRDLEMRTTQTEACVAIELPLDAVVSDVLQPLDILEFVPDVSHFDSLKTVPIEAKAQQLMLRLRRDHVQLRRRKRRWKSLCIAPCRCHGQKSTAHNESSSVQCASCRTGAPKILLRAGLQLVDRLAMLQQEIKTLGFVLYDTAARKSSSVRLEALLPVVPRLANNAGILHRDRIESTLFAEPNQSAEETKCNASPLTVVHAFDWLRGTSAIVQGDVVCAEWISLWRNQRNEFACLCDDGVLYFFSDKQQCHDFLVDRTRAQGSSWNDAQGLLPVALETRKKTRKGRLPLRQIDLLENEWTVRICESDAENNANERHAFAFFDQQNQSRLIVDVATRAQLMVWTSAILNELKQNEFYMQMRRRRLDAVSSDQQRNLGPRFAELVAGIPDKQFEIPLRWLHARMDRLDSTARQERRKSMTFNQALKDLTRDRIRINDVLFDGSGVEQIISALLMRLLQISAPEPKRRNSLDTRSSTGSDDSESVTAEMTALRVAQHLFICCSRTHGGGDILDTLHLMLQSNRFCVCAESRDTEPIHVEIFPGEQRDASGEIRVVPMAEIQIALVYRVACIDEDDKMFSPGEDDVEPSSTDSDSDDAAFAGETPSMACRSDAERQSAPRIRGVYTQKLICMGNEWQELHGSVHVAITD